MNRINFVEQTVLSLDETLFRKLKDFLMGEYISPTFLVAKDLNYAIFAEKLCDHIEKIELKNFKTFEQIIEKYAKDLDAVVCDRIIKESITGENKSAKQVSRAKKYYEKAGLIRKNNLQTEQGLVDYSRIILCLYMAIINNDLNPIENFDFSARCLDLRSIIEALHKETGFLGISKFNFDDIFSADCGTLVVLILMSYYLKSKEYTGVQ